MPNSQEMPNTSSESNFSVFIQSPSGNGKSGYRDTNLKNPWDQNQGDQSEHSSFQQKLKKILQHSLKIFSLKAGILNTISHTRGKKSLSLRCQSWIESNSTSLIHLIIPYTDYSWKSCTSQPRMLVELQKQSLVLFSLTSGFKMSLFTILFYWCSAL